MNGPGKYNDACTVARKSTKAKSAVLIIFGGKEGHGISVQGAPEVVASLPELLEALAQEIRKEMPTS